MKKHIFFRDDDVGALDENFKKLIGIFLWHQIPVHLAVIPGKMTEACRTFLLRCLDKYPALVEIGQHGYNHVNYAPAGAPKYEFGPTRTYADQRADIEAGLAIMRGLSSNAGVFTPPWHGFDANTLDIVSALGFSAFATDQKSCVIKGPAGLRNIRTSVYLNHKGPEGWSTQGATGMLRDIERAADSAVGVLIHHQAFKDKREFDALNDLLFRLKEMPGVSFCTLSAAGMASEDGSA